MFKNYFIHFPQILKMIIWNPNKTSYWKFADAQNLQDGQER